MVRLLARGTCGCWRRRRRGGNRCRWRGNWWLDPDSSSGQRVANNPRSTLPGPWRLSALRCVGVVSPWHGQEGHFATPYTRYARLRNTLMKEPQAIQAAATWSSARAVRIGSQVL